MIIHLSFLLLVGFLADFAEAYGCTEDPTCVLPDCKCFSDALSIPEGLTSDEIPQIVVLSFDDAVTVTNYPNYYQPALFDRKNPNGCPISATFFVSHEYTDYTLVNDLYRRGHEIAIHSITHHVDTEYWENADSDLWSDEMVGMRTIANKFGKIPLEDMKGIRAPFLEMGGNEMFLMLHDNDFEYDCTWSTRVYAEEGLWPYTLDYPSGQDCQVGRCPNETFPGTWVAPMNDLTDRIGFPCAMMDTCERPTNKNEALAFLKDNFFRYYNHTRTPVGYYTHAAWFAFDYNFQAYMEFLDYLSTLPDVYIVSVDRLLEWAKSPLPLDEVDNFLPWICNSSQPENTCGNSYSCHYQNSPVGDRYMTSCIPCTDNYPWLNNPEGL